MKSVISLIGQSPGLRMLIVFGLLAVLNPEMAEAKKKPPKHLVDLEVVNTDPDEIPIRPLSGGILTIRMFANPEPLGLAVPDIYGFFNWFPQYSQTGFIVFDEPEWDPITGTGCFSWDDPACPENESYLQFGVDDDDSPGKGDLYSGDWDRQVLLTDGNGGGAPKLWVYDKTTHGNDALVEVGPAVSGDQPDELRCIEADDTRFSFKSSCSDDDDCFPEADCLSVPFVDGYGYGADDDVPNLVIVSGSGTSLVFDEYFNLSSPRRARNLAGFIDSVGYELRDVSGRARVVATLVEPNGRYGGPFLVYTPRPGLFSPIVLIDDCPDACDACDGTCEEPWRVRIDGGPWTSVDDLEVKDEPEEPYRSDYSGDRLRQHLSEKVITLRIFLVDRRAPAEIVDTTGDGEITYEDVLGMIDPESGEYYQLISGEQVFQFTVFHEELFPGLDFDEGINGVNERKIPPAGAGRLTGIPR